MILTAVAVTFMTTEESKQETEQALTNSYTVLRQQGDESNAALVGESLVNALIIVLVIAAATFLLVLLYKYRCMKIITGYMMGAFFVLLTTLSGRMLQIAVERYQFTIDYITVAVLLYNLSVTGTYAIFVAQGVPKYITQSYLILVSVLVAWELSHFDDFTAYALLVMLALYDLYAVLTPYGPLQALVKLMQAPNAPALGGLLYEASVGHRPGGREDNSSSAAAAAVPVPAAAEEADDGDENNNTEEMENGQGESCEVVCRHDNPPETPRSTCGTGPVDVDEYFDNNHDDSVEMVNQPSEDSTDSNVQPQSNESNVVMAQDSPPTDRHIITIPLALAKIYRLPLVNNPRPLWLQPGNDTTYYSVEELNALVEAIVPASGGTIRPHADQMEDQEIRYQVIDASGQIRRVLFVGKDDGRVFEVRNYEQIIAEYKKNSGSNRRDKIRLGLGDFIFYSVLVSKAALYSWTTFCATTLVILCGLGLTLLLLAWHGKALPALPISIFMGIIFYLTTRFGLQPWVEEVFLQAMYL